MRREHPVVAHEGVPRRRYDRSEPCKQLEWGHQPMLCPTSPELLDPIRDPATGEPAESVEREWWTCPVAHEPLATEIIFGSDSNACVDVEAIQFDGATIAGGTIRIAAHTFSADRRRVGILREAPGRPPVGRDGRARLDR